MSDIVIRAENLGKKYRIEHRQERQQYVSLRDEMTHRVASLFRKSQLPTDKSQLSEDFWALKDVNFEIKQGEVVGIIGRNGAGKSTLLKILSRITEPTTGRVGVKGRLASLLEVGTGFHPELTGRENIYLNGAILGMSREEIKRKFDEIVAFAEVEKFLDTPVKRYSSGMYVRLAFAVAAHMDPEILLVDEVLAVGDRQFQEKCLGRMHSISSQNGKTVFFVSHNLDAIRRICSTGVHLVEGQVAFTGNIGTTIDHYISSSDLSSGDLAKRKERWGTGRIKIIDFQIFNSQKDPVMSLCAGEDYFLVMTYACNILSPRDKKIVASLSIAGLNGVTVLLVSSEFAQQDILLKAQTGQIMCQLKEFNLAPGDYKVTVFLGSLGGEVFDCLNDAVQVMVVGGDYFGSGHPGLPEQCKTLTRSDWSTNP